MKIKLILSLLILSGCSSYKSTWDCPLEQGIGCSSIEYADEMALEQIRLNKMKVSNTKILINQDFLGDELFEEVEIW